MFGCTLAALSLIELSLTVNPLAAALSFSGFLGYVFVYTVWLKRRTPQNIVIGGAAGAVPRWSAGPRSPGSVSGTAVMLFFIVFFWTPPHFWALSLLMKDEYAKVGVPMLPVVRGEAETRGRSCCTRCCCTRSRSCRSAPAASARSTSPPRWCSGSASSPARCACTARRPPLGAAAVPVLAGLPGAAVLRDGRRRPPVGSRRAADDDSADEPTPRAEHPHRPDRGAICMFMFGITFVVAAVYVS